MSASVSVAAVAEEELQAGCMRCRGKEEEQDEEEEEEQNGQEEEEDEEEEDDDDDDDEEEEQKEEEQKEEQKELLFGAVRGAWPDIRPRKEVLAGFLLALAIAWALELLRRFSKSSKELFWW